MPSFWLNFHPTSQIFEDQLAAARVLFYGWQTVLSLALVLCVLCQAACNKQHEDMIYFTFSLLP